MQKEIQISKLFDVSVMERVSTWVGVNDPWERPRPESWRSDVILVGVVLVIGLIDVVIYASLRSLGTSWWRIITATCAAILPLLVRRRFPLFVTAYSGLFLFAGLALVPQLSAITTVFFACFFALFSGVAWARDRRLLVFAALGVLLFLMGWLAWVFAVGSGYQQISEILGTLPASQGPLPRKLAFFLLLLKENAAYFLGAFFLGQVSWRKARSQALIEEQAARLESQSEELRDQAVVNERLRIARELHDVVAHHVSVMGIQAAGARKVLGADPEAAADALKVVEESARRAVTEMRGLLGTLRGQPEGREPYPQLAQVASLVESFADETLQINYKLIEDVPGMAEQLPAPVGLTVYRIIQESLTNIRKHSTAQRATVVVRVMNTTEHAIEVEITNDGIARASTSGSGLGQEGMRERVNALGGSLEMGPRSVEGYRVRARIPLHVMETA